MVGNRSNPARRRFRTADPRERESPGVGELDYEGPGGERLEFDNPAESDDLLDTPMDDDAAALAVLEGDPSEFGFDADGDGDLEDGEGLGDVGSWMDDPIGGFGDDGQGDGQGEAPAQRRRRKRQALSALAVGAKFTQPGKSAVWEVVGPSAVAGHVQVRLVRGRVPGFGRLGVGRLVSNAAVLVQ